MYLLIFSWLITRISFFKNAPVTKWVLLGLFLIKIAAGFAYAFFYARPQYIATADTWNYFHASLAETDWLLRDPLGFVKDLFQYSYTNSGSLFNNQASYWNDLKSNSIIKLIALVNVFTGKSYYINIIFFNFFYFFGPVALYRVATSYWPYQKAILLAPAFLVPSFVFWCSGIHKDGLIFSAMLLAIFMIQWQLRKRRFLVVPCLLMVLCFIVLFALRNFIVLLLIPAFAAWIFSEQNPAKKWLIYGSIYGACIVFFFAAKYIHPALDFPGYIVDKQAEFNTLSGNSKVVLPVLQPTIFSFSAFLPYAIDMSFFQPHWQEVNNKSYLPAIAENTLMIVFIATGIFCAIRFRKMEPFTLFLLFTSGSLLLLSGYTITFAGAIIRYKSVAIPLLATALCIICSKGIKNKHLNILNKQLSDYFLPILSNFWIILKKFY